MNHPKHKVFENSPTPITTLEKSPDGTGIMPPGLSTAYDDTMLCTPQKITLSSAISDLSSPAPNSIFSSPCFLKPENAIVLPSQVMDICNMYASTNLSSYGGPSALSIPGSSSSETVTTSNNNNNVVNAGVTEEEINELIEGLGDDIDLMLDERAEKNKLTVKNVKSILKHVITNKYVLAMVRNTMKWENTEKCDLEEATFEPKLTRSKAKELRDKQETLPWPVSTPAKQSKEISNKILFEEFSDEEGSSDEEYRPNEEELHSLEEEVSSKKKKRAPPIEFYPPEDDCLFIADVEPLTHENMESDQIDRIALRTRSRLPLTDTPLEKIEASFIAPDFTLDMYDTVIDDEEWQNFLLDFNKPLEEKDSNDQLDDDDPEYNVMDVVEEEHEEEEEEHEHDEQEDEDTARITKEEMNALMSEILMEELIQMEDEGIEQQNVEQSIITPEEVPNVPEETNPWMTAYEKIQFEMQMRMHVQLLCQSFLLSHGTEEFAEINKTSASYLEELKVFGSTTREDGKSSAFCAHNLNEAVSIVQAFQMPNMPEEGQEPGSPNTKRKLTTQVKNTMAHSKVFMYPRLLPPVAYQLETSNKVIFTKAEDNLIVLGWAQFNYLEHSSKIAELVHSLLLPTKTVHQIKLRVKNRKSRRTPKDNPIMRFFKYEELPVIPRMLGNFNPNSVKAPCDMSADVLPPWMATYITRPALVLLAPHPPVVPAPVSPQVNLLPSKPKPIKQRLVMRKYSPILPRGYVSPLKKITPILKKYGHHRRILQMTPFGTFIASKPIPIPKPPAQRPIRPKPLVADESIIPCTTSLIVPKMDTLSIEVPISDSLTTEVMLAPTVKACDLNNKQVNSYQNRDSPSKAQMRIGEKVDNDTKTNKANAETREDNTKEAMVVDLDVQEELEDETADDEEDLAALMAASSTICRKNSVIKKKNKHQRDLESTLALLGPTLMESDPKKEEREKLFAQSYLLRAIEALKNEPESCEKFLKLLSNFEYSNKSSLQLFTEINEILKDHPVLVDDFVGFLLPEQARDCGKYLQYRTLYKIREFFRKLEVHFTHQPHHILRILRAFSQLQQQTDVTSASVLAVLQPLLRNQTHLLEEFMQLLPDSTPPECLMTDFEEVEIPNSGDENSCDSFEEIVMPDVPDPYGGKDCPCTCHTSSTSDIRMQNRNRHCVKCGTKFIDGRIYIQTGKVLKPAQVIYHKTEPCSEQSKEVSAPGDAKNSDLEKPPLNLSSDLSHRLKTTFQEQSRSFPKSALIGQGISDPLPSDCISPLPCDVIEDAVLLADARNTSSGIPSDFSCLSKVISPRPSTEMSSFTSVRQNYSHTPNAKERVSSEPSAFNLSFLYGGGGAEVNTVQSVVSAGSSEEQLWTREEDKVILETCQKRGTNPETFVEISTIISTKSSLQIKNRFYELMDLVKKRLNSNR